MAKVEIGIDGTKHYINDKDQYHREDGPAVIWTTGNKEWHTNGKYMGSLNRAGVYSWYPSGARMRRSFPNGLQTVVNGKGNRWPKLK